MLERIVSTMGLVLVISIAATPARALVPAPQLADIHVLTLDGKIYRLPGGMGPAQLEVDIRSTDPNFVGEALDFDPASLEFVSGPGALGSYRRLPKDLSSTGSPIGGLGVLGGQGLTLDLSQPPTQGKSDLLLIDPNPNALGTGIGNGVIRVKGNGSLSLALTVAPQGYNFPMDVEVNPANGELFVTADDTVVPRPAAVLRYASNGAFIEEYNLPSGDNAFSVVFDYRNVVPFYDLVTIARNGPAQRIYLIDVDNDRPSGPRIKLVGDAPAMDQFRNNPVLSPSGALIYPNTEDNQVWSVNLASGAATLLASVPQAKSVAFLTRNALPELDKGAADGIFNVATGPNGRPALAITVSDPEFSSGLVHVLATGSNLAVNGKPLPFEVNLDPRREITQFSFVAEKIDPKANADIQVVAFDVAGIQGDPPLAFAVADPDRLIRPISLDLTELPEGDLTMVVENEGVGRVFVQFDNGTSYVLYAGSRVPSGRTVDARLNPGVPIQIAAEGVTTIRFRDASQVTITPVPVIEGGTVTVMVK